MHYVMHYWMMKAMTKKCFYYYCLFHFVCGYLLSNPLRWSFRTQKILLRPLQGRVKLVWSELIDRRYTPQEIHGLYEE